jgi:hypothetical protein
MMESQWQTLLYMMIQLPSALTIHQELRLTSIILNGQIIRNLIGIILIMEEMSALSTFTGKSFTIVSGTCLHE